MTLGEMIDALAKFDARDSVYFAFGRFEVGCVQSYRGYYDELAIGYHAHEFRKPGKTVGELLDELRSANGKAFEGYKGGSYTMHWRTPMWAANYGEAFQACIVGVTNDHGLAVIETASAELARD